MRTGLGPRPAFLQTVFVAVYSAGWIVGGVILPGIGGRLEQPIALLGFAAIPFAMQRSPRVSLVPPAAVSWGLAGVLGTYCLSFAVNGLEAYAATFVIALVSRVAFFWLGYVLLQNRHLLKASSWLLVWSSVGAAAVALWEMGDLGIGIGRTHGLHLDELMGPWTHVVFYSVQLATVGAVFLVGLSGTVAPRRRVWFIAAAVGILAAAYMSFFRREFLITIPLLLAILWLSGSGIDRRSATLSLLAFVGLSAWEAAGPDSVIQTRLSGQGGDFVTQEETRVVTAQAQMEAIWEQPVFGFGPGMHASAIAPFTPPSERYLAGFNVYGWMAVEAGVLCPLSYVLCLAASFMLVWNCRREDTGGAEMTWIRCGPALIVQVALWGVFGNAWDLPLAWFVIGGVLAAHEVARGARLGDAPLGIGWQRSQGSQLQ